MSHHFEPWILNSQIKRSFLTRKLPFLTNFEKWISEFTDKKSANNKGCLYIGECLMFFWMSIVNEFSWLITRSKYSKLYNSLFRKSNKIIALFSSYFFLFLLSISSTFLKSRVNALSMPFFVIPMELCEKNIQLFNSSFLTPSKWRTFLQLRTWIIRNVSTFLSQEI